MNKIDKPWGYELIWAKTDSYAGKILHINKGHRLSLQYHNEKEETLLLTSGVANVLISKDNNESVVTLSADGERVVHIPPGTIHRIEAVEDSDIVEVSTTELDDVVRLEDDYNR